MGEFYAASAGVHTHAPVGQVADMVSSGAGGINLESVLAVVFVDYGAEYTFGSR
jgi:hypothetical protein